MSDVQQEPATPRHNWRKSHACNECKRRKVRCSGEERCSNCRRDRKECKYNSPMQKFSVFQKRLQEAEQKIQLMERAWAIHLPTVNLKEAIQRLMSGDNIVSQNEVTPTAIRDAPEFPPTIAPDEQPAEPNPAEFSNAEDYEFDESKDFDNSADGMGFLVVEPGKAGYMGPQSGVAGLKFLQSLSLFIPTKNASPFSLDEPNSQSIPVASPTDINRYMDDYFSIYHKAYPILHEGTFRARVSGALAKPRDGSWPILYNIVIAIGAFVGDIDETKCDVPFYKIAREHLSMDILEKGSLSYVQALVLMANYLQKRNKPNSGFVLIGIGFSMALAIGLHREFGMPSSTPFTMELRRRAWWTLFIFVSGAQLTLGRPAVSLVGVNVQLPSNLDDQDLAVDMEELPTPKEGPTVTSCLIYQVKLAKIANKVQVELLTNQIPSNEKAMSLEQDILRWRKDLPAHFDEQVMMDLWFEVPKRNLIWRSFHLRIILNRSILFQTITGKASLAVSIGPINACLTAAEECVESICSFIESGIRRSRGLAWYATYWLITASFVQATCYVYDPAHELAPSWKTHLKRAVDCLSALGNAHCMAFRARDILQKLLDQDKFYPFDASGPIPGGLQGANMDFWQPDFSGRATTQYSTAHDQPDAIFSREGNMSFPWYTQGSSDAELLDAAGGIMLQSYSDSTGPYFENGSWMPA